MIGACHIGGRLAFISAGLELGLNAFTIIIIIIFYNTAYLLLVYSLFVLLSEQVAKFKFIKSLQHKVQSSKRLRSDWNLVSIALFIWTPLPMTGAVIGSLIAYLEGYRHRETLLVAIPSMWIGVISWTLAYERLYKILNLFNPNINIILISLLLILPLVYNFIRKRQENLRFNQKSI